MKELYFTIIKFLKSYPALLALAKIAIVLIVSYVSFTVTRKIIIALVHKATKKTKTDIDDILLGEKTMNSLSFIVPLYVIDAFSPWFGSFSGFIDVVANSLVVIVALIAINHFLNSVIALLERVEKFKDKPIKGYFQVVKIIIFFWGAILFIGTLTGQSPWTLLGGLGAMTAVLLLIFKDTILSLVASVQITSYDLVKIGDWIEVGKYGADGDVIDISLNVVKVQNWDKTITSIPTYKLVDGAFKNWRGMSEAGSRRIARSINIDLSSVKFCDEKMIAKYKEIEILRPYIERKLEELEKWNKERNVSGSAPVNGRRLTNIGSFRAYLKEYLSRREDINKGFTFLVRQLSPTEHGVPIQIYVFANVTAWVEYEEIQADIFDHIFAAVPYFDLRIYQAPSGEDIKELKSGGDK